jgi:hypothetical protein
MNNQTLPTTVEMAHQTLYEVPDAGGLTLRCLSGCLWITLDHDARDIILDAGQSFVPEGQQRAIVYALETSRLKLDPVAVPAPVVQAQPRLRSNRLNSRVQWRSAEALL